MKAEKKIFSLILITFLTSFASAQTTIDDFEDNDLSEYTGETSFYSLTGSNAINGSISLQGQDDGGGHEIYTTSGLSNYPSQNDTISFWIEDVVDDGTTNSYHGFLFGVQDSSNLYLVRINTGNDNVDFFKKSGGSYNKQKEITTGNKIPSGEPFQTKIFWRSNGDIDVRLYDKSGNILGTMNHSETTYTSGGIGFRINSDQSSDIRLFDSVLIEESDSSSESISVEFPTDYKSYAQNSSGNVEMRISGSVSGASSVEACWNGNPCQTVDSSVSSGSFNGTITGANGQGDLVVRIANNTVVNETVSKVSVSKAISIAGQSNAVMKGTYLQCADNGTTEPTIFNGNGTGWFDGTCDPYHPESAVNGYPTGSSWPLLADLFESNKSQVVSYTASAVGGTSVTTWQKGSSSGYYQDLISDVKSAYPYTYENTRIFWHQGESDTGSLSESQYESELISLIDDVKSDLSNPAFFVGRIHDECCSNSQNIIDAQIDVINNETGVYNGGNHTGVTSLLHFESNQSLKEVANIRYNALLEKQETVSEPDTTPPTSSNNWTASGFVDQSSATVELTATDSGGSGVEDIYYRVNGGSYNVVQGSSATVTISSQGNNTLEYYAEDSAGNVEATNTEYVAFETTNAPSASLTKNVSNPKTLETIEFDASGSTDSDGSISSYEWDLNDDGVFDDATGVTATKSYSDNTSSGQTESISVKVTDNDGLTDTSNITFSVDNRQPTASFTKSTTNLKVDVDASGSSDQDGSISSYEWDWTNDGSFDASGQTQSYNYSFGGSYNLKLRVTDDDGATSTVLKTVDVSSDSTSGGGSDTGPTEVSFTLDNVGSSAWVVEDDSTSVAGDSENPDINLEQGKRYTISNNGYGTYGTHPLAFFDSSGNVLLSQSSTGSFESDADVNWVDNGDTVSFTVTQELYSALSGYKCTIHGSMEGDIVQESSSSPSTGGGGGGGSSDDDDTLSVTSTGNQSNSTLVSGGLDNLPTELNPGIGLVIILGLLVLPAYRLIQ